MAKKILIVDDDVDVLRGQTIRLKASGYETVIADDGYRATQMIEKEKPDLILLDLGLPAGDGFVLMDRLRQNVSLIPIVVVSAKDPDTNRERALSAGALAYFQKPVNNDELLAIIQQAVGEAGN